MSDDDLIRRGDALRAIDDAMNVSCAACGCPRNNHHYKHPFVPSTSTDPKDAIRAIPAADAVGVTTYGAAAALQSGGVEAAEAASAGW